MTTFSLEALKEADLRIANVPANMTKFSQALDLTVNGYANRFFKRKFNSFVPSTPFLYPLKISENYKVF